MIPNTLKTAYKKHFEIIVTIRNNGGILLNNATTFNNKRLEQTSLERKLCNRIQ